MNDWQTDRQMAERQTDPLTDGQTEECGQTDLPTDGQTEEWSVRQTGRQTYRWKKLDSKHTDMYMEKRETDTFTVTHTDSRDVEAHL
jgi:hypothetical protein